MDRVWTVLLLFVVVLPGVGLADEVIHLGVGTQRVLTVPEGIQRIAVGDPEVADVRPVGRDQVLILAGKEGRTTLLIWRSNGKRDSHVVVVRHGALDETAAEIRDLLGEREGIVVRTLGDRILLEGNAWTAGDYRRVEQIVDLYPEVRSFVRVAPEARRLVAEQITRAFATAGLPDVKATVVGGTLLLEGTVPSPEDLEKAALIPQALGEKVESLIRVGLKPMVLNEVHFVEVRRSSLLNVGVKLPVNVSGAVDGSLGLTGEGSSSPAVAWEAHATVASDFSLRAALDSGEGRLLAQPRLVCASGDEAEFLAGGEVPLPLITANTAGVEYKPYGIVLRIKPTADSAGNIQTEIEAEVSELDRSVAVAVGAENSVPGFRNRRVKTRVTVRSGETIALSGVFSRNEQKNVGKVPILGSIPFLGELFKQRTIEDVERELVVFVTPRIITAGDERSERLIEKAKGRYLEVEGDVGLQLLD